jgi:hypothetical protein
MSKMAAIHTAISLQLAMDGRNRLEMTGTLAAATRDNPPVAAAYDANTGLIFLARVAFRLLIDAPSLKFDPQSMKDDYLTLQRWLLEDTIALKTQPVVADAKAPATSP